ncbi:MAG: DUF1311 domain-containing protein [Rhizobiaceae bacterium]|nr:DUF1311 domain-containing protein [Rhizobiaceae bacterium]
MRYLLALPFFLAAPATASDHSELTAEEITSCLGAAAAGAARDCIGKIANPCQKGMNVGDKGSPADCLKKEAEAWMTVAESRFEALRKRLKPALVDAVEASQRAFTAYRTAQCDATGEFFSLYSGTASADWEATCLRDTAAERAISLDDWAMRMEDFEQ